MRDNDKGRQTRLPCNVFQLLRLQLICLGLVAGWPLVVWILMVFSVEAAQGNDKGSLPSYWGPLNVKQDWKD